LRDFLTVDVDTLHWPFGLDYSLIRESPSLPLGCTRAPP